jgi:hypothetical protein
MSDIPIYEELIKLVDQVQMATPQQYRAFFTSNVWKHELKHHLERFSRNDDNDLMWIGAKVVVIGNDQSFWALADKIIPKEKHHD